MGGCLSIKCQDDEDKAGSPSPKKKHISGCNTFLSLFFWNGEKITTNTKRLLHYTYLIETLIYYITRKLTNIIIINNKTICDTCSPSSHCLLLLLFPDAGNIRKEYVEEGRAWSRESGFLEAYFYAYWMSKRGQRRAWIVLRPRGLNSHPPTYLMGRAGRFRFTPHGSSEEARHGGEQSAVSLLNNATRSHNRRQLCFLLQEYKFYDNSSRILFFIYKRIDVLGIC